jgi:tRNA dimethylallyltransferase
MQNPFVVFLMGPTCSGKTALAIEWAKQYPVELVNVDSAQVYKGLDIGSAKPDAETLKQFPHRLIDICDPATPYNASEFCRDATKAIEDILQQGRIPLLVGGTMLYFKALQDGLSPLPETDPDVRAKIAELAKEKGWSAMHKDLRAKDPVLAAKLEASDVQRIGRALEVYEMTGQALSELQQQPGKKLGYPVHDFGIMPEDRAALHALIAQRFDEMLNAGFIEEVKKLYTREDLNADLPAIKSVGYRQAWQYLAGEYDFDTMREKAIAGTRQLAKRQMTWMRSWPSLITIDIKAKFSQLMLSQ